jgi:uncharacterized membrane protein
MLEFKLEVTEYGLLIKSMALFHCILRHISFSCQITRLIQKASGSIPNFCEQLMCVKIRQLKQHFPHYFR